jgi:hypothetical protein
MQQKANESRNMTAGISSVHLLVWTILNLIAFTASAFLAVDLVAASSAGMDRRGAAAFYLVWNFGTTILWISEVSYRAFEWRKAARTDESSNNLNLSSVALIVEWSLAILFTFDSIHVLIKWKLRKEDIDADMVEVVLNTLGYAYLSIAMFRGYSGSRAKDQYTPVSDTEGMSTM